MQYLLILEIKLLGIKAKILGSVLLDQKTKWNWARHRRAKYLLACAPNLTVTALLNLARDSTTKVPRIIRTKIRIFLYLAVNDTFWIDRKLH